MYKTILVAFDNTEFSNAALIESANWVKRHGGRMIMVHAVHVDEEEFSNATELLEKRLELGKRVCYKVKEDISSGFGIEIESLICEGEPPEVIVDIAAGKGADLIVMGTHGKGGLKRLIVGSVTSHVISKSPCDVLVVKKPCTECPGVYKSILIPFDGSEFSKRALGRACQLSRSDDSNINVLYVIPRYEEMIDFFKTSSIKKRFLEEAQKIVDSAKDIAAGQGITAKATIEEGHAADRIIEASGKLESDLIVMGSHGWKGVSRAVMGSTTERVIIGALCPILVVR